MDRRQFLTTAGALAAVGGLSLAGRAWAAQPYAGQTVTALLEGHPTTDAIQKLVPEFKALTGVDVEVEAVPEFDISAKMLLDFSSKSGRYDIVENNIIFIKGFVEAGYIVPLDDYVANDGFFDKSDFVPRYLDVSKSNGKLYGLPVYGESTFLMYRKDLFEQYGLAVPKSFDEIEAAAKTISEKSNKQMVGITMRGQQGIQSVYVWAAYLWGMGGSFLDDNGQSALGTPEAAKALEAYARVLRNYGPVGVANFGWEQNRLLFQQGKAAMTLDATVNGAYNEDPTNSVVAGKVGYVPVPMQSASPKGGSSSLAVHCMYVASASAHKEAAALFASWATAKAQQIKSVESDPNSGVTSLGAMNQPSFIKRYGAFKEPMLAAIAQGNPQYLPTIPKANEIINNTGIAISKALAGVASAADALKEADAANRAALAK